MMAASDAEGSAWAAFVAGWWFRYGTAEVKAGDLYEIAVTAEPPLSLGSGNDKSQRTRLGKALGRMRDRVFRVSEIEVRLKAVGVTHQAQQWQLVIAGERGERFPGLDLDSSGERCADQGNVETNVPRLKPLKTMAPGNVGNVGNVFNTYARAHARACEGRTGKTLPTIPTFPNL